MCVGIAWRVGFCSSLGNRSCEDSLLNTKGGHVVAFAFDGMFDGIVRDAAIEHTFRLDKGKVA
jgi:hypothetical protein